MKSKAVVFYHGGDEPLVYLQILDKIRRPLATAALPGTGGGVLFIGSRHLSSDGATDLWWAGGGRPDLIPSLYRYRDAALSEEFHISCDGMAIADFDGDGDEELIAATVDSGVTLQYIGWSSAGGISVLDCAYSSCACRTSWNRSPAASRRSCPAPFSPGRINTDMTASLLVGVQNGRLVPPAGEAPPAMPMVTATQGLPADINGDGIVGPGAPLCPAPPAAAGRDRYFTEYRTLQYGSYSTVAACCRIPPMAGALSCRPPCTTSTGWMP